MSMQMASEGSGEHSVAASRVLRQEERQAIVLGTALAAIAGNDTKRRAPRVEPRPSGATRPAASMRTLVIALIAAAIPVSALSADLPKRKSGLWEITTSEPGGPPGPVAQMCIDQKL